MYDEMKDDKNVIILGEDVAKYGGAYGATNLLEQFGSDRVIDTPISEPTIVGTAIGAAMTGLKPIAELMYVDFGTLWIKLAISHKNKIYVWGQISVPMVIRTQGGTGRSVVHNILEFGIDNVYIPGLYLVMPSNPNDAYHLLRDSLQTNTPTVFIEHKLLYTEGPLDKKIKYNLKKQIY